MKRKFLNVTCLILLAAIVGMIIWGNVQKKSSVNKSYNDGIEKIDPNTIRLDGGKKEVIFSDVILSNQKETRKLIVSTQTGTVETEFKERNVSFLDVKQLTKTQQIKYTGIGYFVVDLDDLKESDIVQDKKAKTLTIKIGHAHLQTVDINPNDIQIDDVKHGMFTWGDIELSAEEYNAVEKDLRNRLENKFNTVENGQVADSNAKDAVKKVYEPIIKAIDSKYEVIVDFR